MWEHCAVVLTAKLVSAFLHATLAAGQTHDIRREPEHVSTGTEDNKIPIWSLKPQLKYRKVTLKQSKSRCSGLVLHFRMRPEHLYSRVTVITHKNGRLGMIGEVFDSSGTDVNGTAQFITCRPHQLKHTKETERYISITNHSVRRSVFM